MILRCSSSGHAARTSETDWADELGQADRPVRGMVCPACARLDPPDPTVTNANTIRQQAQAALTMNRTYIALATPTAAQTMAEVQALARQINGIIRLLLNELNGTD